MIQSIYLPTGSPFTVRVTGEGRIRESITRRQKAASIVSVGSVCDLNLKIPGRNTRLPKCFVFNPNWKFELRESESSLICRAAQPRFLISGSRLTSSRLLFGFTFLLPVVRILFFCLNSFFPYFYSRSTRFFPFPSVFPQRLFFSPPVPPFVSSFLVSPPASWFLLVVSRQHLSRPLFRSSCSLWWSGRSGRGAALDRSASPRWLRLISGLSGLVLAGGASAARGVWVVDSLGSAGRAGVEGAL